jgi:hypothetical protein
MTLFNTPADLPALGKPLIIELITGRQIEGIRPNHPGNTDTAPIWHDMKGNRIQAEEIAGWQLK